MAFGAFGLFWGAWGAALPAVQRRSGAADAELGLALLLVALGALASMRATGVLLDRLGPRLAPASVAAFGVAGLLPPLADSPAKLAVFLLALGAASGAMDVAINAQAAREEIVSRRPLLNLAHATFSGAVVCSSLATGALRSGGASTSVVFGLAGGAVLATAIVTWSREEAWEAPPRERRSRIRGWVLVLGALGALAYWIENAWQSWSAVHLERTLDAEPAVSGLGPAVFAAAMTAGRLSAHRLRPRSERTVLVAGAALAGVGSALAAAAPSAGVALAGIVVAGAGCSVCAPTILSVAGRAAAPGERGTIVGSVTTLMYLGFLVGPAAVGGLAELTTLRISLGSVAALAFLLSLLFVRVRLPARER
ncbi:MAG TPA: MFS transporter [Gaiellaceae bacterium]|nr:MFS transporter [Gaiellaceae bacterium]